MTTRLSYYIAEATDNEIFTADIVRLHQESIMHEAGFSEIKFNYSSKNTGFFKLLRLIKCLKIAITLSRESTVYFHFPFMARVFSLLQKILYWRGIKTIVLIIDIDGLRENKNELLKNEMKTLRRFNVLVAHNEAMRKVICQYLPNAAILNMNLFDYYFRDSISSRILSNKICFAGNLAKSPFIYQLNHLNEQLFYLYGKSFSPVGEMNSNISYQGTIEPELLPAVLKGSFGLVWDGDSIETCNEYLRYNNPHKLSLYLAAGLPVIVWKDSAVAAFVAEHKTGILVNSLLELPQVLKKLGETEYAAMQAAAIAISKKIKAGYYFRKVLAEIADL